MCIKMSGVRLSNASPTLERVDARQPDNVRPPVSRNLFGSPDREEIRRYLDASIQDSVRDFSEEYNFDPVNDRPLTPRNYEWERVSDAAEFYHRQPHGRQQPQRDAVNPGDDNRQDAEQSSGAQLHRLTTVDDSRKRRSGASGSCSDECPRKRSHTDEGDDDQSDGAASPAVRAEESASRPEKSAEVQ